MDVPSRIKLTAADGRVVLADIAPLDRETAKEISPGWTDTNWWTDCAAVRAVEDEPDHHWDWVALVSRNQNKPMCRAVCVRTPDSRIQGAMIYRIGVESALEPGKEAVFVDRLATAPSNRQELVEYPEFRGVGVGLLRYAIAESWYYGLRGRVNLFPIANLEFYRNRKFQQTDVNDTDGSDVMYELSAADGEAWLLEDGVL